MDKKFVISVAVLMSFMSGCISVQQIQKSDQTAAVNQGGATQPQASASSSPAATPTPVSSSTPASPVSSSTPTSTTEIDLTGTWTGSYFTTVPCSIYMELTQNNADIYTPITGGGRDCAGLFGCSGALAGNQLTLTTDTGAILEGVVSGNTINATVTNALGFSYALTLTKK